jgi:hypothetical protein
MELLSKKVTIDGLVIEISIHDLSYRMGFRPGDIPINHLFVSFTAQDHRGTRLWTTPLLTDEGKVKPYSSVTEALSDAMARIGVQENLKAS